jgi:pullulanase/glycogen debranching enzyme
MALEERGGWGNASANAGARGETPTPALPRKRERGKKSQRNTPSSAGNPMITAAAISA